MATGRVSVRYVDGQGFSTTSDVYVNVPGGGTITNLQAEFAALATLINNVTGCVVTGMAYHINVDVSGLTPNTPNTLVSVDNALALKYPNQSNSRPWDFIVPGLAQSNIVSGGPDMTEGGAIDLLADVLEANMATSGLTAGYYANNQFLELAPTATGFLAKRKLARKVRSRSARIGF